MNHIEYLRSLVLNGNHACGPGTRYASRYSSLREAWEKCERSDWMLWLLRASGVRDARRYRLFACWCVRNTPLSDGRNVWNLLDGPHRDLVVMAERFAKGYATRKQLAAAEAAYVSFSYAAAASHAYTAAASVSAAYAAEAAAVYAASAASHAVYAAAAAPHAAYAAAAYANARRAQADQLREMFAEAFDWIEARIAATSGKEE